MHSGLSLNERVRRLEMRSEHERDSRKANDDELAKKLDVVMTMMDGWRRGRSVFKKEPIRKIGRAHV